MTFSCVVLCGCARVCFCIFLTLFCCAVPEFVLSCRRVGASAHHVFLSDSI